jgi:hypothetical protein
MNGSIFEYGFPIAALVMIALIIWTPTVLVFIRRQQGDKRPTHARLFAVLAGEFAVLVAIAAAVDYAGLRDVGGYLLAFALVIGALGPHALSFKSRRGG